MHGSFRGACLLLTVAICSAGCRPQEPPAAPARVPAREALSDDLGRPWEGPLPARRIVSLAPNVTEIVCAVGGREHLAGIDTASDYPPAVKQIPQVGEFLRPSIERIVSLRPDAVIVSSATLPAHEADRFAQTLRAPVFVLNPTRLEDVPQRAPHWPATRIGARRSCRREDGAPPGGRRAGRGQRRRSVFLEIWHEPLTTVGGHLPGRSDRPGGRPERRRVAEEALPHLQSGGASRRQSEVYVVATGMGATSDRRSGLFSQSARRARQASYQSRRSGDPPTHAWRRVPSTCCERSIRGASR